mmetsp:Transcript_111982/g.323580  ORF Transcript_111982/g.323580 Transcript_111982/m.323580 type:complete len:254 (-) Transcript_111982:1109-1870(-)
MEMTCSARVSSRDSRKPRTPSASAVELLPFASEVSSPSTFNGFQQYAPLQTMSMRTFFVSNCFSRACCISSRARPRSTEAASATASSVPATTASPSMPRSSRSNAGADGSDEAMAAAAAMSVETAAGEPSPTPDRSSASAAMSGGTSVATRLPSARRCRFVRTGAWPATAGAPVSSAEACDEGLDGDGDEESGKATAPSASCGRSLREEGEEPPLSCASTVGARSASKPPTVRGGRLDKAPPEEGKSCEAMLW